MSPPRVISLAPQSERRGCLLVLTTIAEPVAPDQRPHVGSEIRHRRGTVGGWSMAHTRRRPKSAPFRSLATFPLFCCELRSLKTGWPAWVRSRVSRAGAALRTCSWQEGAFRDVRKAVGRSLAKVPVTRPPAHRLPEPRHYLARVPQGVRTAALNAHGHLARKRPCATGPCFLRARSARGHPKCFR
jgi:hypothetical protein